jgi:hypothetical protein
MSDQSYESTGRENIRFGDYLLRPGDRTIINKDGRVFPLRQHAILLLIALTDPPGVTISKQDVIRKLWPDSVAGAGANRLYHTIHSIRRQLGDDLIVLHRGGIRLDVVAPYTSPDAASDGVIRDNLPLVLEPIRIAVMPGDATAAELAHLFHEISTLYTMSGGGGLSFYFEDTREIELQLT